MKTKLGGGGGGVGWSYLWDGEVEADQDDDGDKEEVEGSHHEEGLLQEEELLECVVELCVDRWRQDMYTSHLSQNISPAGSHDQYQDL